MFGLTTKSIVPHRRKQSSAPSPTVLSAEHARPVDLPRGRPCSTPTSSTSSATGVRTASAAAAVVRSAAAPAAATTSSGSTSTAAAATVSATATAICTSAWIPPAVVWSAASAPATTLRSALVRAAGLPATDLWLVRPTVPAVSSLSALAALVIPLAPVTTPVLWPAPDASAVRSSAAVPAAVAPADAPWGSTGLPAVVRCPAVPRAADPTPPPCPLRHRRHSVSPAQDRLSGSCVQDIPGAQARTRSCFTRSCNSVRGVNPDTVHADTTPCSSNGDKLPRATQWTVARA